MHKKIDCPICKKKVVFVGVHDDEGNYHGPVGCEYENDPWSGLSYALHHDGWGDCPLCTDGAYSTMGGMLFDTAEEAINALTPPNEWVSVEDRLPEDEARQYIEDELYGIGYLYPCLLTYKSPNTERIHVVRFYYDIIQKWFVNNGEELCEKGRCIAWMPLPAPYDRRPPEGET